MSKPNETPFKEQPAGVLRHELARAIAALPADFSSFSDEEILEQARVNGVVPLLLHRSQSTDISGLSDSLIKHLGNESKAHATRDLILNRDTRQLLELLADNEIPALLLKGTPLSLLAYEKPYLRERCDSDIYILTTSVAKIAELLEGRGYTINNLGVRKYASKQFQASTRTFKNIWSTFDIHYRLSNRVLFRQALPFDECWEEKQPVSGLGAEAWALSDRDLLIHACIHRIAHGRGTERNRLVWLYDIHLLWSRMNDQEKQAFAEKARAKKIGAVCADALEICKQLFDTDCGSGSNRAAITVGADSAANHQWLNLLRENQHSEPTAKLINASKPRWAIADLMATPGLTAKFVFARELILKR